MRVCLRLLFIMVAASLAVSAQTKPLRLVSTAWPPFTNQPGQPRFALDLVEAALGRGGLASSTTIVDAAKFTPLLMGNEFDGSAAAWKDAERESALIFSQPYLENRLILVGRRGADVSATSLNQLDGKRVAIVEGYSYGDALDFSGASLLRSRSDEDSLALLLASKTDYTLMDELVVQYLVDNYPTQASTRLEIGSKALVTRPLYLAVKRARPDAETIVTRFNGEVRAMIVDRTYHRLLHVSWISADIDGDGDAEFVPASDQSGTSEPRRAYALSTTTGQRTSKVPEDKPGFYVGGNIYTNWASVPNRYKVDDPSAPDASRSTASIFRFTW